MWWIATVGAWASEPQIETLDSGMIRGRIVVPANPESVQALIRDPAALVKVTSETSKVESATPMAGNCRKVTLFTPHPIMPVTYTSKDCDTASGMVSTLVESKQLSHFEASWTVKPEGGASVVVYDLDLKVSAMIPAFIIRRSTRKSVEEALVGLQKSFAK